MLAKLITRFVLEDLAGATVFRRGEEYFHSGAVTRLRATEDKLTAKVEGTDSYRVELRKDDGALGYDCSCPHAADGNFCKHCVAVGLAWLAGRTEGERPGGRSGRAKQRDPWRDIERFLAKQSPAALIELLLDVARRDDPLYQRLLLKANQVRGGSSVVTAFRRAIDDATQVDGFVGWREARTFAEGIRQVADSLAELLKPDSAAKLVELAEYAIERIEGALEQVDDSAGETSDLVQCLGELHCKACTMARPDPVVLAGRLFRLETTLPFRLCSFDAVTYAKALGRVGLQRYRELAEAEWSKVTLRNDENGYDAHRATIARVMERLAEAGGDVDELVAIKAKDLSSGYRYLAIAEVLTKAGRANEALAWAERGLKAFPDRPDDRLRDFLVSAYLKRRRNDEALQLTWAQFEERTGLESFIKLHGIAGKLGAWPEQRERAMTLIASRAVRGAGMTTRAKSNPLMPDHSLRVSIALWERDFDTAWTAVQQGLCDRHLLIALAAKLASSRPSDAISLYRRVVPTLVEETNNASYEAAIKLVRQLGALMKAQQQPGPFGDYLDELRAQFKPKRNFIKLLDGVAGNR